MKTLCIVPCGKQKIWQKFPDAGPEKAKDVYIGPYASKCIHYAQAFYHESWCILSAKYGFLMPNDLIHGPYEVTFIKKSTNPISKEELLNQVLKKGIDDFDEIIVLGGKCYCDIIDEIFREKLISKPLCGLSLGEAIKPLNESINKRIPL